MDPDVERAEYAHENSHDHEKWKLLVHSDLVSSLVKVMATGIEQLHETKQFEALENNHGNRCCKQRFPQIKNVVEISCKLYREQDAANGCSEGGSHSDRNCGREYLMPQCIIASHLSVGQVGSQTAYQVHQRSHHAYRQPRT